MDIEKLDFKEKSFNGIWAVTSLIHIPKKKMPDVVKKLYKILNEDGVIHVCVKEGEGEKFVDDKEGECKRFFAFYKEKELIEMFEDKFNLAEFFKDKLGNTVFMHFFFRKK